MITSDRLDGVVFDVVIVGAGTVGIYMAHKLSKLGKRICLLESGGESSTINTLELNSVLITGLPHDGAIHGRARVLGGTSTLWGGQLTKFQSADLTRPTANGVDYAWPISYDDLEAGYKEVLADFGIEDNGPDEGVVELGMGFESFWTRWLRQPNMASNYRNLIDGSECVVILNATVIDILCTGSEVDRLTYVCSEEVRSIRASKFILASGTVEISRLLLHSAKSPTAPWRTCPWLGKGFQDHVDASVGSLSIVNREKFGKLFQNRIVRGGKVQPKIRRTDPGVLNIAASFQFHSDLTEQLTALKAIVRSIRTGSRGSPTNVWRAFVGVRALWLPLIANYLRGGRIYSPFDRGVTVRLHCEHSLTPESCIRLSDSKVDKYGVPLASINWVYDPELQVREMRNFVIELSSAMDRYGLAKITIDEDLANASPEFMDRSRDSYHLCGGARMGIALADGVVDTYGKVHGTDNLYVAGAAIFRTSGFANPTLTAFALGTRTIRAINV